MAIVKSVGGDSELRVGVEDDEVGIAAGFECSGSMIYSGKRCRCAAHPADDVVESKATALSILCG